jgi:hypothetical protein
MARVQPQAIEPQCDECEYLDRRYLVHHLHYWPCSLLCKRRGCYPPCCDPCCDTCSFGDDYYRHRGSTDKSATTMIQRHTKCTKDWLWILLQISCVLFGVIGVFVTVSNNVKDAYLTFPCRTTSVYAKVECDQSCVQSYRQLEWNWPQPRGPIYSIEQQLKWLCRLESSSCSTTSISFSASGLLNTSESCWIHSNSGSYYTRVAAEMQWLTPRESLNVWWNILTTVLIVWAVLTLIFTRGMYVLHLFKLHKQRCQDLSLHEYHLKHNGYFVFMMGLRVPMYDTPLHTFVNDPLFDHRHMIPLIGSFLQSDIVQREAITNDDTHDDHHSTNDIKGTDNARLPRIHLGQLHDIKSL